MEIRFFDFPSIFSRSRFFSYFPMSCSSFFWRLFFPFRLVQPFLQSGGGQHAQPCHRLVNVRRHGMEKLGTIFPQISLVCPFSAGSGFPSFGVWLFALMETQGIYLAFFFFIFLDWKSARMLRRTGSLRAYRRRKSAAFPFNEV